MSNIVPARIGSPFHGSGAAATLGTAFAIAASNSALEFIFEVPEDITCTKVGVLYGLRTGTPPTYIASIQSVDGSANPSGTILGGASPASVTFTPPADTSWDNTWRDLTLANSIALSAGTVYALVIGYSAGTVDGSNNSSFVPLLGTFSSNRAPFAIQNLATVRTRQTAGLPIFSIGSASKVYCCPVLSAYSSTIDSTTTPDEVALAWSLPATFIGGSYTVAGIAFSGVVAAAKTVLVQLYSGTTVLQTRSWDTDYCGTANSSGYFELMFPTPLTVLSAGATYRIGFQPSASGAAFGVRGINVNAAGDMAAHAYGAWFYSSTRKSAGAWTDVTTRRLMAELILADMTGHAGRLVGGELVQRV